MNKAARLSAVLVAAATLAMACPAYAFASEGGGIEAILPKMNEFLPMLVAFIILWIILAKFGWPIFEGMLDKRERTIADALQKSEEARIESERLLAEYQSQLADAKSQAATIIAEAKETGEAVEASIKQKAAEEAESMIEKARIAIDAERKAAMTELQGSVADLSVTVASRLVGNDLSDDEHRAIIERYIKEAGSFHAE